MRGARGDDLLARGASPLAATIVHGFRVSHAREPALCLRPGDEAPDSVMLANRLVASAPRPSSPQRRRRSAAPRWRSTIDTHASWAGPAPTRASSPAGPTRAFADTQPPPAEVSYVPAARSPYHDRRSNDKE